jgi:hypothetical protein
VCRNCCQRGDNNATRDKTFVIVRICDPGCAEIVVKEDTNNATRDKTFVIVQIYNQLFTLDLRFLFRLGSMDFVLEIHAEEICNDPVRCIIAQVRIGIMNLLNLNDRILNIEQNKSRTF